MATGAIDYLINKLRPKQLYLMGRPPLLDLITPSFHSHHPFPIPYSKKGRWSKLLFPPLPVPIEIGVSFRSSLYSRLFLTRVARHPYSFPKGLPGHMVEKYSQFVVKILNKITNSSYSPVPFPPFLSIPPKKYLQPTIGINPGATYGSAKRWYPDRFAQVINQLGTKFNILIFGGPGEEPIAHEIEKKLTISNYQNLVAQLTLSQLASHIAGLTLFITNDSGPMHIAAAYQVPIVAIFGPTDWRETSPWTKNAKIVRIPLPCSPCKKRHCPTGTHQCMKAITPEMVLKAVYKLLPTSSADLKRRYKM